MRALLILLSFLAVSIQIAAQSKIPKEELIQRRENLFKKIGNGIGIIWGADVPTAPGKYNQSPDFYYLTGLEEQNGILLMIGQTRQVFIFSKKSSERDVRWNGPSA